MRTFELRQTGGPLIAAGEERDDGTCRVLLAGHWRDAPSVETAAEWVKGLSPTGVEVVWT